MKKAVKKESLNGEESEESIRQLLELSTMLPPVHLPKVCKVLFSHYMGRRRGVLK